MRYYSDPRDDSAKNAASPRRPAGASAQGSVPPPPRPGGPRPPRPQAGQLQDSRARAEQARRLAEARRGRYPDADSPVAHRPLNQAGVRRVGGSTSALAATGGKAPRRPDARGRRPSPPQNGRSKKDKKPRDKKRLILIIILDLLILGLFAAALYFLLQPIIINMRQVALRDKISDRLQNENAPVKVEIARNFGRVNGEMIENWAQGGQPKAFVEPEEVKDTKVSLTYIGMLFIPSIQIRTPLAPSADLYTLRFGVGIYQDGPDLAAPGLTSIFGHRFLTKGRDFNRIDEIKVGDTFSILDNRTHTRYNFVVSKTDIIDQKELWAAIHPSVQPKVKTVVLVSCHPLVYDPQLPQRILVYGELKSKEQVDNK